MTTWLGSISARHSSNWETCKREKLFGSNKTAALDVRAGDDILVWGAERGWLGRCRATHDARPAISSHVPWPEPSRYEAVIPMTVIDEPSAPVFMSGPEFTAVTGLDTVQIRNFDRLTPDSAGHIVHLLGGRPQATPTVEEALDETLGGRLLRDIDALRVDRQLGAPAPYQNLVLLRAISRAVRGEERLQAFSDARDELKRLLEPFAVGRTVPDPALPWWALRTSAWWKLIGAPVEPVHRGRDVVRQSDLAAGLSREAHQLVLEDEAFRERAINRLTSPLAGHRALSPTLAALFSDVEVASSAPLSASDGASAKFQPEQPSPPTAGTGPDLALPTEVSIEVLKWPLHAQPAPVPIAPEAANKGNLAAEPQPRSNGVYLAGSVYDRGSLHNAARDAGLTPGNRMSGITVVGDDLCVFWNPFKGLYANRWIDEPREFMYSGEGSVGDQTETGGNLRLIEHESDGRPVLVFLKTRREGSAWLHLGLYQVTEHSWGDSQDTAGEWRRDLRFRFASLVEPPASVPGQLPFVPAAPLPVTPTEAELWDALQRRNETGERRRTTRIQRNKRVSDPLKTDYVIQRAIDFGGACELCDRYPGWVGDDGRPHYQAHHIHPDIDLVDWIAALCGTCHDRMHHATDRSEVADQLLVTVQKRQRMIGRPTVSLASMTPAAGDAR